MTIGWFLNYKERVNKFIILYITPTGLKPLIKDNKLKPYHWLELKYLYIYLKKFYEATLTVKGKWTDLVDYF